jgi:hypothetical protein
MPTFLRVRRKRGPALAWTPTQDSYYELAQTLRSEGRLPLYLTQTAILEIEAHLRESSLPLPFGLLAGDVCVCPQTKLEYVLVDTVSRARVELGGDDPYVQLAEELQSLASEQSTKRKVAIGWYLGGLADDLTLDDDVTRLHEQLFPQRWQLALVRGTASGAERGAFLRYESIWSRWYSIPFFEFLPEREGQKKGERRTAIRWENYRADEPARPLDESEVSARRVNVAPRPSWGARLFGASLEPLPRAERATPGRVAERAPATSAPARQEPPSVPRSQTVTPPVAPPPTGTVPVSRKNLLEIPPSPLRAPEPPPVQPAERKVAVPVVDTVTVPIQRKLPASVGSRVTASVDQMRAAPVEEKVTAPAELRVAAMVAPTVATPAETRVAREEPELEVPHVFIDGILVPAPLPSELFQNPGMSPGSDRMSMSTVVVGALLLLILVSLYLAAS